LTARLKETYDKEVFKALMDKFQYSNVMEVPKLEKSPSTWDLEKPRKTLRSWKLQLQRSVLSQVRDR
jgi:hypothetical protein